MDPIVVVGSGASGVHFALSCLIKGHSVTMVDVGFTGRQPSLPTETLVGLKRNLTDPVDYFLGPRYDSLVLPGHEGEYYAFPPSKEHVFRSRGEPEFRANGFAPLYSFARGGLAEVWTGGCYPFDNQDLNAFPFEYKGLEPYYSLVAERIGVSGTSDDLKATFPVHGGLQEPLNPDAHSVDLLAAYSRRREYLNRELGCLMGRSRVAALSRDLDGRQACNYSGRCLWGCPRQALYTPSITLEKCRTFPNFRYLGGFYADHFRMDSSGRVQSLVARSVDGKHEEIPAGTLVLSAGTLGSAKIFLESIQRDTGKAPELRGVMDNRQILMPFVNLRMLGRPWSPETYQYHQIAMAVRVKESGELIHGLITTLKTALIHPLVQTLPFDLAGSVSAFRSIHGALGMININFPDHRRQDNYVTLDTATEPHRLAIQYQPEPGEPPRLAATIKTFRKILWKLGCFAPTQMIHVRPMGASVHYAGTLPMTREGGQYSCTEFGASRDVAGLYFADGTTFPSLPAKNLTFTLMANAARIAEEAF
jgi:choline dehydrogenase-like flavoprotein